MPLSEALDHLLQLASHGLRFIGELTVLNRLPRGDRIDCRDFNLAKPKFLDDDVAGQHRPDLVLELERL